MTTKVTKPTCKATTTKLTISVTDANDGINPKDKWSDFLMKWRISVKQPTDYLDTAAGVTA